MTKVRVLLLVRNNNFVLSMTRLLGFYANAVLKIYFPGYLRSDPGLWTFLYDFLPFHEMARVSKRKRERHLVFRD